MAGIYIHIPFCKQFCTYCDFYSSTSLARKPEVLGAICDELEQQAGFLNDRKIGTVYFGGGTPSLCSPGEVGRILGRIGELFDVSALEETTLEANPDDLTAEYAAAVREAGINRLSIGVQSFIDRDLRWMNRRHTAEGARAAVQNARAAGFSNITIDLIYGIPGMTLQEWEYNLREALSLGAPHISAYHLTIEDGTPLGKELKKGKIAPVGDEASEEQYLLLHDALTGAGYEHYEVSNFAKPCMRAVHNGNYWKGREYLGVGPAAHSYNGRQRRWNVADVSEYLKKQPLGKHSETEELTAGMLYNEYVMTALRTADGVDAKVLLEKFGARRLQFFTSRCERFLRLGTMAENNGVYRITAEKFLVSDAVIAELFA